MNRKSLPAARRAFTLMEMVIVVGVILILILMALLVLNPRASIDKAFDAHRKKDLENLKIAFESYYSDYSCYPTQELIENCDSDDLDPYIKEIPCDPSINAPYELIAEPTNCPQNFIAYAELKRDQDPSADGFNCFTVTSPNAQPDPAHDCTDYYSAFTPSGGTGGTGGTTGTPTPSVSSTPTPPLMPTYYCSNLNNCTELDQNKTCIPSFSDIYCSGACSDPTNICTPQ